MILLVALDPAVELRGVETMPPAAPAPGALALVELDLARRALAAAVVLRRLGDEVEVVAAAGGCLCGPLRERLGELGIDLHLVPVLAPLPCDVRVVPSDPQHAGARWRGPTPTLGMADAQDLLAGAADRLDAADVLLLAGDPARGPVDFAAARIVALATARGLPTVVDVQAESLLGELPALPTGWVRAGPGCVLPARVAASAAVVRTAGAARIAVEQGASRAWLAPPRIAARRSDGGGAAFVAGLAHGRALGDEAVEAAILGAATAAAELVRAAPASFDRSDVDGFAAQVEVERGSATS
jgi:fructose-1-phosphate kinase PfkB-like protein